MHATCYHGCLPVSLQTAPTHPLRRLQFEDPPLHDPCAVAYVIAPELFKVRRLQQRGSPECAAFNVSAAGTCSGPAAAAARLLTRCALPALLPPPP